MRLLDVPLLRGREWLSLLVASLGLAVAAHASPAEPEALRHLRLCVSGGEEDPVTHCQKAAEGGLDRARTAQAYTLLGLYLEPEPEEEQFQRMEKAEASYRTALVAFPQSALAAFRLGRLLAALGKSAEALEWLDRACALEPEWAAAHMTRAQALWSLKRLDEAVRALEASARGVPERAAEALARAGEIEEDRGRRAEANQLYRRAAAAGPQDPGLGVELGGRLSSSGQRAEATAVLLAAFSTRRLDDGELLAGLSSSLGFVGRHGEALQAAREAAAAEPDSPHVLRQLAFALRAADKLEEALATHRYWRSVAPNDEVALWDQGQALSEAGRLDEAIGVFRVFYEQFPQRRRDAARLLGRALAGARRYDEAIPLLKEGGEVEMAAALEKETAGSKPPENER